MKSIFLENLHHAYARTDGTYAFPNSREGDMLRAAKKEIESLMKGLEVADAFHAVAVAERNQARAQLDICTRRRAQKGMTNEPMAM